MGMEGVERRIIEDGMKGGREESEGWQRTEREVEKDGMKDGRRQQERG